jgi:hypothetical protein
MTAITTSFKISEAHLARLQAYEMTLTTCKLRLKLLQQALSLRKLWLSLYAKP